MIKKIFLGLGLVVVICIAIGAYVTHTNNERVRFETIEANHIHIVNKIISSNEIDVQGIKEIKQAVADEPDFKEYVEILNKYLEIADKGEEAYNDSPVQIVVNTKQPTPSGTWDASVVITNKTEKDIEHVDFEIVGINAAGETIACKNKTKCRWTDLKAGTSAKTGFWTLYLEKDMMKDAFSARDVQVYFTDGTTWVYVPAALKNMDALKEAFSNAIAKHK